MFKRCLHLLHALACSNERVSDMAHVYTWLTTLCEYVQVQKRLFNSLDELLRADLPILPLADLLTEVKTAFLLIPNVTISIQQPAH